MADNITCWHCGTAINGILLPLSRREECPHCGVDLHVCKMCQHFISDGRGDCSEERAEWQADQERANFCDYFTPNPNAYHPSQTEKTEQAKAKFAALFGDDPTPTQSQPNDTDLTPAQIAEKKLREMLGN